MLEKSTKNWKTILEEETAMKLVNSKQTRRGKEIFLLSLAFVSMIALGFVLHTNMADDDWTQNPNTRSRVLVLAIILFIISIMVCYYTINRLGVKACNPSRGQDNLTSTSSLITQDLPPCYDSIKLNIQYLPPPAYNDVNLQICPVSTLGTSHHQATG